MRYQNFNYKGWEFTNPGWHEFEIKIVYGTSADEAKYREIVQWLYEHIDNCERHARWVLDIDRIRVKFRYEKDYTWFTLRWA